MEVFQKRLSDFAGAPVVTDLPSGAGGHRFNPWSGKTLHAVGQLGLEPHMQSPRALLDPVLHRRCRGEEKPVPP